MQQLFRCDYCTEVGTAEELMKHEAECIYNYKRKSCWTCAYAKRDFSKHTCNNGVDIPEGKFFENCSAYKWDEKDHIRRNLFNGSPLLGSLFGGL